MSKKIGVNAVIGANIKSFSTAMQNVKRKAKGAKASLAAIAGGAAVAGGALLVAGGRALAAWDKQAQAIAQVEAGLKSTGNAAGFTSSQLQKMAGDLQKKTIFGDEDILKNATANLLTFTNIAGDQFKQTQEAVLDLATRTQTDLKSAAIQLGKALNDPVKNLSALSRAGIQFSDEQKTLIKRLWNTNRHAEAQSVILNELKKQFGGSAEAAAKAGLGGFKQLQNSIGDLWETIGKGLIPLLTPVVNKLKEWADSLEKIISFSNMFGKNADEELYALKNRETLLKDQIYFSDAFTGSSKKLREELKKVRAEIDKHQKKKGKKGKDGRSLLSTLQDDSNNTPPPPPDPPELTAAQKEYLKEVRSDRKAKVLQGSQSDQGRSLPGSLGEQMAGLNLAGGIDATTHAVERLSVAYIGLSEAEERAMQRQGKLKAMLFDINEVLSDLGVEMASFVNESIYGLVEAVGTALVTGTGDSFKEWGRGMLEGLADIAQKFGVQLLAIGIGLEAFTIAMKDPAKAPIAIAAGLALVAGAAMVKASLAKSADSFSAGGTSGGGMENLRLDSTVKAGDIALSYDGFKGRRR